MRPATRIPTATAHCPRLRCRSRCRTPRRPAAGHRHPAASPRRRHRSRRPLLRVRDDVRGRAEGQLPDVQRCSGSAARWWIPTSCGACSTRRRRRRPASTAGTTAIPRSIACSTWRAQRTTEAERKKYYGEAQKIIAEDAPYISIWNRTNVAVAQTDADRTAPQCRQQFRVAERRHENSRVRNHRPPEIGGSAPRGTGASRNPPYLRVSAKPVLVRGPGPAERLRPGEADPARRSPHRGTRFVTAQLKLLH